MKCIYLIFFLISINSYGQDDCVFDQSTQTDEFIRDIEEFKNYTWDDKAKEATIILSNGDTLIAQRGGCHHFGISGLLIEKVVIQNALDQKYFFEKGLWIAERLFHPTDFEELKEKFKNKDYVIEIDDKALFFMYFNHDYFSEYFLRAEKSYGFYKIEIGYYFG